ncbi:protein HEADING DATE 3B-like [Bidens hawaiensis]|uniref:protein HEADING DATE 3B-like n=1 Tax=Bidens hawaiensis TaxID=980011 RepID=UPI004048EB46
MSPVYGMSLTPTNADFLTNGYNIPTSNYQQGIGVFPSTSILTSYGFPTITKHVCSPKIDDGLNCGKSTKIACNIESDLHGSSGSSSNERKKDELPLFPTTPMVQDSDNHCIEEKHGFDERMKVIKVVPHNPKLASKSAARIFQFIQEGRKHNE